jgi:TatA/E family protein of Tat protein translocase
MFESPEKLFILLVIALLIFGPSKVAGFGGTLGRMIRDFRSTVRGAQEEFASSMRDAHEAVQDARDTFASAEQSYTASAPALALPNPDALEPASLPSAGTDLPTAAPVEEPKVAHESGVGVKEDDFEGPHSLASEPPAHALRERERDVSG